MNLLLCKGWNLSDITMGPMILWAISAHQMPVLRLYKGTYELSGIFVTWSVILALYVPVYCKTSFCISLLSSSELV